jgi:hypothetical protein
MLPGYGVLIGTYDHSGTHVGQWLHEVLYINANGTMYECAVDVNEPTGIFQYMTLHGLDATLFQNVSSRPDGWHDLVRAPGTGAVDYIRSPLVQRSEGCLTLILGILGIVFGSKEKVWNDVTGNEAGDALVRLVTGSTRIYVFGAPYEHPNPYPGVHDIHMNQGDPVTSVQFHQLDGIWQDGCVIVAGADGKLAGYFGKFATQSLNTDDSGYPV